MATRAASKDRPKMSDVGRLAGVSAQTVSRYFTGSGYVGADTRRRIEAAINELEYTFNESARNLRLQSTQTIGVLTTGPSVYGSWSIQTGLLQAADAAHYALITSRVEVEPDDPAAESAVHEALLRLTARVDGIVVSTPYLGIEEMLEKVWERVPLVILSGRAAPIADSATVDSHAAGLLAINHLIELGHRRILHIAGPESRNESHERERGYTDAMTNAGLTPLPSVRGDWSAASGEAASHATDPTSYTAVFSANDQMALGFMSTERKRGRVAPRDYSIVGVDDMPDTRYFEPALTTVYMDFEGLGRAGIQMLLERLQTGKRIPKTVIEPSLVIRDSTAAPADS